MSEAKKSHASMQPPHLRPNPLKDSNRAWELFEQNIETVFDLMRWHYSQAMNRSVAYEGQPPAGRWHVGGYFGGRQAIDFVEETEAGLMERAAHALELWDGKQAKAVSYLDTAIRNQLMDEKAYWLKTSSNPVGTLSVDYLMDEDEPGAAALREEYQDDLTGGDPAEMVEVVVEHDGKGDPRLGVLTDEERYALERVVDGASQAEIAEDLQDLFPRSEGWNREQARYLISQAMKKARQA